MNWAELERKYPAAHPHHNWMEPRTVNPDGSHLPPGEVRYHTARDITFPAGTAIRAQLPGKVTYVGYIPNQYGPAFGYMVRVKNTDGSIYKYIHLEPWTVVVHENQQVFPGTMIGRTRLGRVGQSKSHLHIETIRGGAPVDPAIDISIPLFADVGFGLIELTLIGAVGYIIYKRWYHDIK